MKKNHPDYKGEDLFNEEEDKEKEKNDWRYQRTFNET